MLKPLKTLANQSKPCRFVFAYLLFKLKCNINFSFARLDYRLKWNPTILTFSLLSNPAGRLGEELFLRSLLKEADVAIDVGANIGTISLSLSRQVGQSGSVFSFEPHPRIFQVLKENISLNRIDNISAFNTALGEQEGVILFTDYTTDDINRVAAIDFSHHNSIEVNISRLDKFTQSIKSIALIKIDVEGSELSVLKGGFNSLMKTKYIYFESNEGHYKNFGYSLSDIYDYLTSNGFDLFKINPIKKTISPVMAGYVSDRGENLIAFREVYLESFLIQTGYQIVSNDV